MADAWSTVVEREPEFDDYTRSRIMALHLWEAGRCPNCHNYDCLVELKSSALDYVWDDLNGERFAVRQYRCLACASADVVRRDFNTRHENHKPVAGQASPADGRMFVSRRATEED